MTDLADQAQRPMTGAEYKTLREALGLSAREAARFHRIASDRTIRHWENGRAPVPAGAADELRTIDAGIDRAVGEATAAYREQAGRGPAETVELYRYRDPAVYAASQPGREGLPIGAHGVLVDRARRALEALGVTVAIVYADPPMS